MEISNAQGKIMMQYLLRSTAVLCALFIFTGLLTFKSYAEETADPYDVTKNILPNLLEGAAFSENVDEYSGTLYINHTDLSIPGNGGLDITINRHYVSPEYSFSGAAFFGARWDVHMGYVASPAEFGNFTTGRTLGSNQGDFYLCSFDGGLAPLASGSYSEYNPSLHLPTGERQVLANILNGEADNYSIKTSGGWRGGCLSSGYVLFSPNGLKYTFDKRLPIPGVKNSSRQWYGWFVSKIEDKYGNSLSLVYTSGKGLTSVTASDGRVINLEYSEVGASGEQKLTSITAYGTTINYSYNSDEKLQKVTLNDRTLWEYAYVSSSPTISNGEPLNYIKTESGGEIEYTYTWWGTIRDKQPNLAVESRTTSGNLPSNTKYFTYRDIVLNSPTDPTYTTIVSPPVDDTPIFQLRVTKDEELCKTTIFHTTESSTYLSGQPYLRYYYGNKNCTGSILKKESFSYSGQRFSNQNVRILIDVESQRFRESNYYIGSISEKSIEIEGINYVTKYSDYTIFNKPKIIEEQSSVVGSGETLAYRKTINSFNESVDEKLSFGLEHHLGSTIVNSSGKTLKNTTNTYNSKFELTKSKNNGIVKNYTYDSHGNVSKVTDALGNNINYSDYYRGKARSVSDSIGTRTSTVDYLGNVTSRTNERGYKTNYSFEDFNRLTSIDYPTGSDVTINYSDSQYTVTFGKLLIRYDVDGFNRETLITKKDTYLNETRYQNIEYNKDGNIAFSSVLSNSPTETVGTTIDYDIFGRVKKTKSPSNTVEYTYQSSGVIKSTNALGYSYYDTYLGYGSPDYHNIVKIEAPSSSGTIITEIDKDAVGRVLSVSQGNSSGSERYSIEYKYNSTYLDLIAQEITPQFTHYKLYNVSGALWKSKTGASNSYTIYSYDERNRLKKINYPDSTPDITYSYTTTNQLKTVVNSLASWNYTYDALDRVKQSKIVTKDLSYYYTQVYDGLGHLNYIDYNGEHKVQYYANAFGEHTDIGNDSNVDAYIDNVKYYANGHLRSFSFGNGVEQSYTLNAQKLPERITTTLKNGTDAFDTTYSYDANANIETITDNVNSSYSIDLAYDGLDRLISANGKWGKGTFNYDVFGNITEKSLGSSNLIYDYDSTNALKKISGTSSYSFEYDSRGNVISNGQSSYSFNSANSLIRGNEVTYTYDGNGHRLSKTVSGKTTLFVYGLDGKLVYKKNANDDVVNNVYLNNQLAMKIESEAYQGTETTFCYDGSKDEYNYITEMSAYLYLDNLIELFWEAYDTSSSFCVDPNNYEYDLENYQLLIDEYVDLVGEDDLTLPFSLETNEGKTLYNHTYNYIVQDLLGSSVLELNANGKVIDSTHYRPYGQPIEGVDNDEKGYTGHLHDNDLGLIYMQARYYDPVIGRFYSNDPVDALGQMQRGNSIVHGFNRYAYVNNNPYKYTDPNGEFLSPNILITNPELMIMGNKLIEATSIKASVGAPGMKGKFDAPNSPLSIDVGVGLTGGIKVDDQGLSVELSAEASFEASDSVGNSAKLQLAKGNTSLSGGVTTTSYEGPKAEFTSASGGAAESDGVLKFGGKIGFAQVEIEVDITKFEN